jgi:hypothetical protein
MNAAEAAASVVLSSGRLLFSSDQGNTSPVQALRIDPMLRTVTLVSVPRCGGC